MRIAQGELMSGFVRGNAAFGGLPYSAKVGAVTAPRHTATEAVRGLGGLTPNEADELVESQCERGGAVPIEDLVDPEDKGANHWIRQSPADRG